MLTGYLKKVDGFLRNFLWIIPKPQQYRQIDFPSSTLFIRPGGIGDAVLLFPVIKQLKIQKPHINITVLAERRNRLVFSMVPEVDKVLCYDIPKEFIKAFTCRYDLVIDTEQWYRLSAVVARLIRAPVKIGFGTNERRRMFTHVVEYDGSAYEVLNFAALLKPLGIKCEGFQSYMKTSLVVSSQVDAKASQILNRLEQRKIVAIFSGASKKEKCWGGKNFRRVAEALVENGYGIVIVGGRDELADGAYISNGLGGSLAGQITLPETAAVVARSSLLISGDSGILHIAALLGTPTVSLFGPSSVEKWAPKGDKHIALARRLACSPCSRYGTIPPCPHNVLCMKEITGDQVLEAAVSLLQKFG